MICRGIHELMNQYLDDDRKVLPRGQEIRLIAGTAGLLVSFWACGRVERILVILDCGARMANLFGASMLSIPRP